MRLAEIMKPNVLTLTTGQPAGDAWAILCSEHVRHAVVVFGTEIVGVISDRDLGGPNGGPVRRGRTVADLMHRDPITAAPETPLAEGAAAIRSKHIGCLPIVEDGRLVGIVTRTDLLRALDPTAPPEDEPPARGAADVPRPPLAASPNVDKHT